MTPLGITVRLLLLMFYAIRHVAPLGLDVSFVTKSWNHTFSPLMGVLNDRSEHWSRVVSQPIQYNFIEENFIIGETNFEYSNQTIWRVLVDTRDTPSNMVCEMATLYNIPYIKTSLPLSGLCSSTTVLRSLSDFMVTVVKLFNSAESFSLQIITNYDFGVISDVLKTTNYSSDRLLLHSLTEATTAGSKITHDAVPTVVIASYSEIKTLFSEILKRKSQTSNFWVVIPTDSESCPEIALSYYICLHHHFPKHKTILQFSDDSIYRSFDAILQTYASFLLGLNASAHNTTQSAFETYVAEAGDMFKANTDIIITRHSNEYGKELIGSWKSGEELRINTLPFPQLSSFHLKVVVIHEPPFVERIVTNNGTTFKGYTIDVLDEIAKRMGFQYTAYEVPDKQYGVNKGGKWTGVIGQVSEGFADMGAGPVSVTAERESVIDFTVPYYDYAGLQILMRDPALMQSLFVFASVFTWQAWAVWFALLFGTSFCIYLFTKWKYKTFSKIDIHEKRPRDMYFSLANTFWFVVTSVSLAGPEQSPRMFSSRMLVSGFWFFCQILMATYTANLAAFLTSSRLVSPIESIEDLAMQSEYVYTVQAGAVGETYFERMANIENNFYTIWREMSFLSDDASSINKYSVWDYPLGDKYLRLWNTIQTTGMVKSSEEGIEKVLSGGYAFFHETPMIEYEMQRICGLMKVGPMFSAKPYAFVLPQNSLLLEKMSRIILTLQTETILANMKNKWWETNTTKCEKMGEATGLSFNALGGIFIVMAVGCGLSVLLLCLELIIASYRKHSKDLSQNNKTESRVALSNVESCGSLSSSNSKADILEEPSSSF